MVKFTVEAAQKMMENRDLVRNLGVIAHIDHGKSTLTDSLLAASGLLAEKVAGEARATDTREDEQERGITIKTTGISLFHEMRDKEFLINLQDTPGHVDFSGEVTAALRVVDGALVVVDAVEGVMVQTEVVLRQALQERVRPVLIINKVDRLITEMKMKPEAAYEQFKKIIRDFNILIELYAYPEFKKEWKVDPKQGTVAFGSAVHRFGLTIPALAEIWSEKLNKPKKELIQHFWRKENFVQAVLKPTYAIYNAAEEGNTTFLKEKVLPRIGVKVDDTIFMQSPKKIAKAILEEWLPVEKAVLDMVCTFCPSPAEAQKYRFASFWKGDMDSEIGKSLVKCDEKGPLMIAISKMVLMRAKRVIAIGRVYSGTITPGDKIACMIPGYVQGRKERRFTTSVQTVGVIMGKDAERAEKVVAGNIVAISGLKGATSSSTVTSLDDTLPFEALSFAVEPVVTLAIETKNPSDLPKLAEGMKLLELVDPSLKTHINEETGEYLLMGTGELHLEIAVKDLQDMQKITINQSQPIVVFRESVESTSERPSLAKSPNKHNRLWVTAEPLEPVIIKAIEGRDITQYSDKKEVATMLRDFGWDKSLAKKLWGMGPEETDPNVFVDGTKGVQYLREVKDYITQGFRWGAKDGPLCGEPFYGVKFLLRDCQLHEDPVHRGMAQIMPVARRSTFGAMLMAKPVLLEPYYKIQVQAPENHLGSIYKVLTRRRGRILDTKQREGTPMAVVDGELPVSESIGMTAELRSETSGFAFAQLVFSHWEKVPGDPLIPEEQGGGISRKFVEETRQRKGMHSITPPSWENYYDRL
ncbi:MAG: GTP-binding protein [Candidatus Hodarchaeales archaeon]